MPSFVTSVGGQLSENAVVASTTGVWAELSADRVSGAPVFTCDPEHAEEYDDANHVLINDAAADADDDSV